MSSDFNPYHVWLDLPAKLRRPNYYQLLQIRPSEAEPEKVTAAADRALARVRGFKPGDQAAAWSSLLDELSKARTCLTDPAKKQAYDQALKKRLQQRAAASQQKPAAQSEAASVNSSPDLYPPGMAPAAAQKSKKRAPASQPASEKPSAGTAGSPGKRSPQPAASSPKAKKAAAAPNAGAQKPGAKKSAAPATGGSQADKAPGKGTVKGGAKSTPKPQSTKPTPRGSSEDPLASPSTPINAHVAPPPAPKHSIIPVVLGVAAALGLLTLGMLYLALSSA